MTSDLSDRLVAAGVSLVAEGRPVSLREIARRAGVSHGAPRRYFPTHEALLGAIAREGYRELARQLAIVLGSGRVRSQVLALARTYVDFARTQQGMYELMFRHDLLRGNEIGLRQESLSLFAVLVDLVGRARPTVTRPAVVAGALWANLHGVASLWLWGSLQVAVEIDDIEPLLRAAIDAHLGPTRS